MKRIVMVILYLAMVRSVWGTLAIYTNEASYKTAIAQYITISEGFEGSAWVPARVPNYTSSVVSQGITWTANDKISVVNSAFTRSGIYAVLDRFGVTDTLTATTSSMDLMCAAGGWFNCSKYVSNVQLSIKIDGVTLGTRSIGASHSFYGVIDTDGFNTVNFVSNTYAMGADDFTFGIIPEPATLLLVGIGAVAIRKRK